MNSRSSPVFSVLVAALVVAGGTILLMQRRQTIELRVAHERAKQGADQMSRLREENRRLRAQQVSPAVLERLRSDHEALPRLRAEFEALQQETNPPGARDAPDGTSNIEH